MKIKAIVNPNDSRQEIYINFLKAMFPQIITETNPDMFYVVGGDGALLHAHNNFSNFHIPFFGKGLGTLNFIMNNFEQDLTILNKLLNDEISVDIIETPKIKVTVKKANTTDMVSAKSINDVIIGSDISDWNLFNMSSENGSFNKFSFGGTGLCVSTPLGSSAFNLNNGGKLLPIDSKLWSITSVVSNKKINELMEPQTICLRVDSVRSNPSLYVDGVKICSLTYGDEVILKKSSETFEIAFLDSKDFNNKRMRLIQSKR